MQDPDNGVYSDYQPRHVCGFSPATTTFLPHQYDHSMPIDICTIKLHYKDSGFSWVIGYPNIYQLSPRNIHIYFEIESKMVNLSIIQWGIYDNETG